MEKGKWFVYSEFVYGVLASEERMKALLLEQKINPETTYHEGQGPTLFELHEECNALDGYYLGEQKNPKGLVVGMLLYDNENESILGSEIDSDALEEMLIEAREAFEIFEFMEDIEKVLQIEKAEPKLHLVTTINFITHEEMIGNEFGAYDRYLEEDVWDYRS